jgi:hypothetical protein
MTTRTDIINRALAAISAQADIANSAENSKEAVAARLLYDPTRQQLLRSAHWNFARRTAGLTLLKAAPGTPENPAAATSAGWTPDLPAPPWLYAYLVPADCLQLRYVLPQTVAGGGSMAPGMGAPGAGLLPQLFVLASDVNGQGQAVNVVLSNQRRAIAVYTADVQNEGLWDAAFQEAMVFGLAARFAMTIAGDKTLARLVSQQAMMAVGTARATDGNEGLTVNQHQPDWLRARGAAGDGPCGAFTTGWITPAFLTV